MERNVTHSGQKWELHRPAQFYSVHLEGREQTGDQSADGTMTLRCILKDIGYEGVEWIHLAQDKDH
jgi:hypothetical protein